jgi:carbamoyl-phosphate synthase large subunit
VADSPLTVLVTAIGGGGHGEQIVKALRLAGHGRYRIVGGDVTQQCPQFSLVDQPVVLPKADEPGYVEAVLHLCSKLGVRALFHGCEPELRVLSRERARFAAAGIFLPVNPADVIATCMDKSATARFLEKSGFRPPWTEPFLGTESIDRVPAYPVILKPSRGAGGSRDCYIAQDRRELTVLAEYLDVGKQPFVLQEYVGTPEHEYTVGVLRDLEGRFVNSIAVRRLLHGSLTVRLAVPNRTGRPELGRTLVVSTGISHGEIRDFSIVRSGCERIAEALGACGPINIQCRLVGDEVKVFEINPRFSGTTSVRAMMGYNEPDVLIRRHVLGESITPRFPYRHGWVLRSLSETVLPEVARPTWQELS